MSQVFSLSYVLTTFNKFQYLQVTLPLLINACKPDEEIVIVDGGSNDGSAGFLQDLFERCKIHQLISERDRGEAHGTNKGLLMAKGKLVKIISDDDVYSYENIQVCKNFMLNNPDIDLLATSGFYLNVLARDKIKIHSNDQLLAYQIWVHNKQPFLFTGLGIMLRRKSISLLGLFDSSYFIVDFEYSLRVTSGNAKLAWYSGYTFVNIINPSSNSHKHWIRLYNEKERLIKLYGLKSHFIGTRYVVMRSKLSLWVRSLFGKSRRMDPVEFDYRELVDRAQSHLKESSEKDTGKFF